jgi:3-hydroxybutyryl-CoA dehydrogenase
VSVWKCGECDRIYGYELPVCTFCGGVLSAGGADYGEVLAVTEVLSPPTGHAEVPYWVALVGCTDSSRRLVKLDRYVDTGEIVGIGVDVRPALAVVGVIGTGVMGRGLTELLLIKGHRVVWCGRAQAGLGRAREKVFDRLSRVMDQTQIEHASGLLSTSTDLAALAACGVVIEAVVEDLGPKSKVLAAAEKAMRPDAVLATNTSGLSLDDLSRSLERPERFGALHFFNPATRMRLVETSVCASSAPETGDYLDGFAISLGKVPVRVAATPAFVVNRALMPLLNEAVRTLEEGVAPAQDIDAAIRLGLNHPMGPLALADLIGLDVVADIMDNLAQRTGDPTYAPRPMLRGLVEQGHFGRKTGRGFYDYAPKTAGPAAADGK